MSEPTEDEIRAADAVVPEAALKMFADLRSRGVKLLKESTAIEHRRILLRLLDEARAQAEAHRQWIDTAVEKCARRQCSERDKRMAELEAQSEANRRDAELGACLLAQHVHYYGSLHDDDCPEDDTCSCPLAAGVNDLLRRYPQKPIDIDAAMQEPGRD